MWVFFFKRKDSAIYTDIHVQGDTGQQMIKAVITNRTSQGPKSHLQERKAEQYQTGENLFVLHKWVGLMCHKRKSQSWGRSCFNHRCFTSGLHSLLPIWLSFSPTWSKQLLRTKCHTRQYIALVHISHALLQQKKCPSQWYHVKNLTLFKLKIWNAKYIFF